MPYGKNPPLQTRLSFCRYVYRPFFVPLIVHVSGSLVYPSSHYTVNPPSLRYKIVSDLFLNSLFEYDS